VVGGLAILGSVIVCGATLFLCQFLSILNSFVLSVTIVLMICLVLLNDALVRYRKALMEIEKVTPHVLEELTTIYLTTESIFESIEYVSKGEYGTISKAFTGMITALNNGTAPEQLLQHYADSQPSITLRRGLHTFIQFVEASTSNIEAVITDAHEALQRRFEWRTLQWESRMMVISGVLVFVPIIFILGIAIRGLANHPLVLILPVIQIILSKIMLSSLLPTDLILLGE
jgi:hypothetical protein